MWASSAYRDITRRKKLSKNCGKAKPTWRPRSGSHILEAWNWIWSTPTNRKKIRYAGPKKYIGFLGTSPEARTVETSVLPYCASEEEVQQTLDYALCETKPYAIDFRIIRPDGTERNIHERGDIIFDPKTQKPQRLVASVQDVTERVQAEIRLNNANRELAEKVQELEQRTKEINLLSEMGGRLQTCKNVEEAFIEIGNKAEQLFPRWSGALCITSASRTAVETVAEWGKAAGGERVFAPDDCWALRQGHTQSFRRGEKPAPCRHIDLGCDRITLCPVHGARGSARHRDFANERRPGTARARAPIRQDANRQLSWPNKWLWRLEI